MSNQPKPENYTNLDAFLKDLGEYAWSDQDAFVISDYGTRAHIESGRRESLCSNGPESSGDTAPNRRETAAYPPAWREDLDWCQYCLSQHYEGCDYRLLDARIGGFEGVDVDAVVSSYRRSPLSVYHTRECNAYPESPREASRELVAGLRECKYCKRLREGG